MPSFVNRHVGRCECCSHFLESSKALGLRLEQDAGLRRTRPCFLEDLPVAAVRRNYSLQLAMITASVLVLCGFLVFHQSNVATQGGLSTAQVIPEEGMRILVSMTDITPDILAIGRGDILGVELDNLAFDAHSAVQHLADSLLVGISDLN